MKRLFFMAMALAAIACTPEDRVGEVMTAWQEGWFEIHSINTARGECFFYILLMVICKAYYRYFYIVIHK